MSTARSEKTFHLDQFIHLLCRLDVLISEGEGDSEAAEQVRDEMELHWRKLTPDELKLTDGLAIDLSHINDGSARRASGGALSNPASPDRHQVLDSALKAGDWDRVLMIVRENESQLIAGQAAALRGIAWDHLGHPEVAALFFEEAARLAPNDRDIRIAYPRSLVKSRQFEKAKAAAEEIAASSTDPLLLFLAADVLFDCASVDWPQVDLAMLPRVVEIAERASNGLGAPPADEALSQLACSALLSLAISKDLLNDGRRAAEAGAQARNVFPSVFGAPGSSPEVVESANGSTSRVIAWRLMRDKLKDAA